MVHLPPAEVFEVLLHGAAHGLNAARHIPDTSRGGRYHNRRFAITVDLRLVPADRLKPDTASSFHGAVLSDDFTLPLAIVRKECDPKNGKPCAHAYKLADDGAHQLERTHPYRSFVRLSGKSDTATNRKILGLG